MRSHVAIPCPYGSYNKAVFNIVARSQVCPVCENPNLVSTVLRVNLPAMQNRIYRKIESAKNAAQGQFDLAVCSNCGFAHNSRFDSALVEYDKEYDNSMPSSVMKAYHEELATYLNEKYLSNEGLVVDIGCGKGTFLKNLCGLLPNVRGLGIDPGYEGESQLNGGRIQFISDFFSEEHLSERPALVVCRHVLEHIPDPVSFLKVIHTALAAFPNVPFFVEVPDARWILDNRVFWDFCYEHCNYFTPGSLFNTVRLSGFVPSTWRTAFGEQFLWLEASNQGQTEASENCAMPTNLAEEFIRYAPEEQRLIAKAQQKLRELKSEGWTIAIWGMAAKGINFSFLVDVDGSLIDFCIDANPNKQGCFLPLTGRLIESPERLREIRSERLIIVVMNPNYLAEIQESCKKLFLKPVFLDAHGNNL
jgi:SAM-dependent methyltransferase